VTLDVTHTLVDCPRLGAIYAEVLARHGVTVAPAAVMRTVPAVWQELSSEAPLPCDRFASHPEGARGWWQVFIERVCELLGAPTPSRFATAELFDRFAHAEAWEIFPEVPATLAALVERGIRLAVVSNWDDRLPLLLERLGLAGFLDAIVFSAGVGWEKPDPAIFRAALSLLDVEPQAALHVGDHLREDVEGARALGMHALHLDRRHGRGDLADLTGLLSWVQA